MTEPDLIVGPHRLRVYQAGPADGRPIVLLHGIGVSARYLFPLMRELSSRGFHAVAIDLPGFGDASKPRPGDLPDITGYGRIVREFIALQKLGKPVFIGHSMGCQIAVELERRYPGAVRQLVLIGLTPNPLERRALLHAMRLMQDCFGEPLRLLLLQAREYLRCGPRRFRRALHCMLSDPIEHKLPEVRGPILMLRGGRDPIANHAWSASAAALAPRASLVEIGGARHAVHYSLPAETARQCELFMRI